MAPQAAPTPTPTPTPAPAPESASAPEGRLLASAIHTTEPRVREMSLGDAAKRIQRGPALPVAAAPPDEPADSAGGQSDDDGEAVGDPTDGQEAAEGNESEREPMQEANPDAVEAPSLSIKTLPPERLNEKFSIKVNGEVVETNLKDLFAGYARNDDYSRRVNAITAEKKAVAQERQQYGVMLNVLGQRIQSEMQAEKAQIEALAESDPIGYLTAKERYRDRLTAFQATQAEQARVQQLQQHELDRQVEEHATAELGKLVSSFPDEQLDRLENRQKFGARLLDGLQKEYGLSRDDVAGLGDHRAFLILHDALKYRAMSKKGADIRAKVSTGTPPAPVAPNAQRTQVDGNAQTFKRLASALEKSGKVSDAAALISARSRMNNR